MSSVPVVAGIASTVIFASSTLPMLAKAYRTKDLSSYSFGNLALANTGNAVHSVYVFALPAGPIWALHSFYVATSALMLLWYLRARPDVIEDGDVIKNSGDAERESSTVDAVTAGSAMRRSQTGFPATP